MNPKSGWKYRLTIAVLSTIFLILMLAAPLALVLFCLSLFGVAGVAMLIGWVVKDDPYHYVGRLGDWVDERLA